jgi:hypothetical protein
VGLRPVRDAVAGSGVASDHLQAREWATALAGRVGMLLGGSFLGWLEGPPVLVSTPVLTDR